MALKGECRLCRSQDLTTQITFDKWVSYASECLDGRTGLATAVARSPGLFFGDIVRCANCGLYSVEQVPPAEELANFYHRYQGNRGYSRKQNKKIKRASSRIQRLRKQRSAKTFLDVGCNLGYAVEAARQCGLSATGIEIGRGAFELARAAFPNSEFICGDITTWPAQGRQFDIVYCSEVIEHVPDFIRFSEAITALVSPQGTLFLTTPYASHWRLPGDFWK